MLKKAAFVIACLVLVSAAVSAGEEPRIVRGKVLLGYTETTGAPDTKCVGGVPAEDLPCSLGTTQVISRSEVQVWMPSSPSRLVARLLDGPITFVVNCDLNGQYRGPCWGTFEWTIAGVGTWTGFWTAPVMDLMTYESKLTMVGVGSGGEIKGKQIELEGASAPGDWYIASVVHIW